MCTCVTYMDDPKSSTIKSNKAQDTRINVGHEEVNMSKSMRSTKRCAHCPVYDIVFKVQSYFQHLEHHRYGDTQDEGNLTAKTSPLGLFLTRTRRIWC